MAPRSVWAFVALVAVVYFASSVDARIGRFWHLTDIHVDLGYQVGGDVRLACRKTPIPVPVERQAKRVGARYCDSPLFLVNSAFDFMKSVLPNPDFIIWTGDDVPHLPGAMLTLNLTLNAMANNTNQVLKAFPGVKVIPSLGNHDWFPVHQIVPREDPNFHYVADIWKHWLVNADLQTFHKGGFYSTEVVPGLRVLAINTVFYYSLDKQALNETDPAGQFKWIRATLEKARQNKEKVYVISHVPPGMSEKSNGRNMWPQFNDKYLDVFDGYQDVIVAFFHGHEHTDALRLLRKPGGEPTGVMFLHSAVSPWESITRPEIPGTNPSLRYFEYDTETFEIVDYVQYWASLADALKTDRLEWKEEYRFSTQYKVDVPLNVKNIAPLVKRFQQFPDEFDTYLANNAVQFKYECNDKCKKIQMCAIISPYLADYQACLEAAKRD